MRRPSHSALLLVAVALLAAPAAWACCQAGAMGSSCPMDATAISTDSTAMQDDDSMGAAPCHAPARAPSGPEVRPNAGCEMSPVLAPVAAPSFDFARTLPTLEVVALAAVSPQTSTQRATVRVEPPRAQRLHDVGRYTLFSSLLL